MRRVSAETKKVIEDCTCSNLKRNITDRAVQLDVYLPNKQLSFEYQGEQHYFDVYALGSKWNQQQRDEEKRILCIENGITLIEVPYWWDFEKLSLISTIHDQRPDLIPIKTESESIPSKPLNGFRAGDRLHFYLFHYTF